MSPIFSSAGPDVTRICEPISFAMMCASVVFPSPGFPYSNTCSIGSSRFFAAPMNTFRFSFNPSCPTKSASVFGRRENSKSRSSGDAEVVTGSVASNSSRSIIWERLERRERLERPKISVLWVTERGSARNVWKRKNDSGESLRGQWLGREVGSDTIVWAMDFLASAFPGTEDFRTTAFWNESDVNHVSINAHLHCVCICNESKNAFVKRQKFFLRHDGPPMSIL